MYVLFPGKSIKDLVSKDNMDENVQINDKPLWKQDDRSWISSLYKRAPSILPGASSVASSVEAQPSNIISENKVNPNEGPQPIATTVRTIEESDAKQEDKTSSSKSRMEKTHPRDVYETIKEMLNAEDKFHQVRIYLFIFCMNFINFTIILFFFFNVPYSR